MDDEYITSLCNSKSLRVRLRITVGGIIDRFHDVLIVGSLRGSLCFYRLDAVIGSKPIDAKIFYNIVPIEGPGQQFRTADFSKAQIHQEDNKGKGQSLPSISLVAENPLIHRNKRRFLLQQDNQEHDIDPI